MDEEWSDPESDAEQETSLEPGRPTLENAAFVLLGVLAAVLALSQMLAFL